MISLPLILVGCGVIFWTRWQRTDRKWPMPQEVAYYLVGVALVVAGGLLDVNTRW